MVTAKHLIVMAAALLVCVGGMIHLAVVAERLGNDVDSMRREVHEVRRDGRQRSEFEQTTARTLSEQGESLENLLQEVSAMGERLSKYQLAIVTMKLAQPRDAESPAAKLPAPARPSIPYSRPQSEKADEAQDDPVRPELRGEFRRRLASGFACLAGREFRMAAHEFTAALAFNKSDWSVRQRLLNALLMSGSFLEAYAHLVAAISLCKGTLPPGTLLECFKTEEEFAAWLKNLENGMRDRPHDEKLAFLAGYAYYSAGMNEEALQVLMRIKALEPGNEEAAKLMSAVEEAMAEPEENE